MDMKEQHRQNLEKAVDVYVDQLDLETLVYLVTENLWAELINSPMQEQLDFIAVTFDPTA